MTFLLNLLPLCKKYWKQIALVIAVAGAIWYVWSAITTYGQERYDAGFAKRDAQYKDELQKMQDEYVRQIEHLQEVNNELSTSYSTALADIRKRPPGRAVWVCDAPASGVPKAPGTGATAGANGAASQGLQEAPRRDLGPFFYHEADDADALALQLETLQSWVSQVCVNREHLRTTF